VKCEDGYDSSIKRDGRGLEPDLPQAQGSSWTDVRPLMSVGQLVSHKNINKISDSWKYETGRKNV